MKKIIILICLITLFLAGLACQIGTPTPTPPDGARAVSKREISPNPTETPLEATKRPEGMHKSNICTVYAENLHLRAFPGVSASVVAYLKAGDQLTPTSSPPAGLWVEVFTQAGRVGWVNSKYIQCEGK